MVIFQQSLCDRLPGGNATETRHLDDMAESFLMSAFRNGSLRTMKALIPPWWTMIPKGWLQYPKKKAQRVTVF